MLIRILLTILTILTIFKGESLRHYLNKFFNPIVTSTVFVLPYLIKYKLSYGVCILIGGLAQAIPNNLI